MASKRELMKQSHTKWTRIARLLRELRNFPLGCYEDCGYCRMHNVSEDDDNGCQECTLRFASLCYGGDGRAFNSVRHLARGNKLLEAICGADAIVIAINNDLSAIAAVRNAKAAKTGQGYSERKSHANDS